MKIQLQVNGKSMEVEVDGEEMLLWTLRDKLQLTGTKYGCGVAQCGACTVHLDGKPVRACVLPTTALAGRSITTIEGIAENGLHPVQEAWIEAQVPQCGYCQSGQIMQAVHVLNENPNPTREEIVEQMDGILCRCGTYHRIIKAIQIAAKS